MMLNPDQSVNNFYPNAAVILAASYATIDGIKTYGQVLIFDNVTSHTLVNPTIKNSDLGGGGPFGGWSHVLFAQSTNGLLVQNNYIHHSVVSSSAATHKAIVNNYSSINGFYEYNTFEDGWTSAKDLAIGDGAMDGGAMTIRYNLFKTATNGASGGIYGNAQGTTGLLHGVIVHNNIFIADSGIGIGNTFDGPWLIYNNTFVNGTGNNISAGYPPSLYNNNIFYLSSTGTFAAPTAGTMTSDYNIYYIVTGTGSYKTGDTTRATSLSGWQSYSSQDANSISSNPNFINASGTTAESFKRSSYAENFTGSSYSVHAGAYETGSEQIGHDWNGSGDTTPPVNPSGFSVS